MTLAKIISKIIAAIGLLLVVCTLLSLLHSTSLWFIQIFNFPRLQALVVLVVCLIAYVLVEKKRGSKWALFTISAMAAAVLVNVIYLYPYTPLAVSKIASANKQQNDKKNEFSIMLANVYMKNREASSLLTIVRETSPSLLLTMEVDGWWINALQPLAKEYPHKILFPTGNTYGMALYSKLPLDDTQTLFFNHDSVPSFSCKVSLPGGNAFRLLAVHPVAPKASEHPDNKNDKEIGLIAAGREISQATLPAIVAGDFNDVGWSPNVGKFEEISGLKDVRIGRGLYNTFSAENIFMRWPLDYVYTSSHFKVINIERLPKFGSDHFPLLTRLVLSK